MPHSKSAKKRLRQNLKRRNENRHRISRMRTEVKKALATIDSGKVDDAKNQVKLAFKFLDKAAKRNIIHPNRAAREKSRLARMIGAMQAS